MSGSDDLVVEHAFLKAPSEELTKSFRTRQKQLHKELTTLSAAAATLGCSPSQADLAPIVARLTSLRATLDSTRAGELLAVSRCAARLAHLSSAPAPSSQTGTWKTTAPWEKTRLDRLLVDYMLRRGLSGPAASLASSTQVEALCDLRLFASARAISSALVARDVGPALRWCSENRRRLSRVGSSLEFLLRLQEVVEFARAGQRESAIAYVRAHLVGDPAHIREVQRVMALLAFPPGTECEPYKSMYADERWNELVDTFRNDNFRLHGLPGESLVETTVKAGLSTLKTRQCSNTATFNSRCPTCIEPFRTLAKELPRAQHVHSVLVCSVSKCIMDEDNPPMALPNGNVYGHNYLQQVADANSGVVIDPKTGEDFQMTDLRKCFIM